MLQPSFVDPLHMQYFQHPFGDAYSPSVQHSRLASSGVTRALVDPSMQKEPTVAAYMVDPKLQSPTNGGLGISNQRKGGITVGSYYGGPPGMGVMAQFPASPIPSPVLLSSPVGGTSHLGRQSEIRLSQGSNRNAGVYSGWQEQREINIYDDSKRPSFLGELKSSNAQKFELNDIAGCMVEFSVDQHGSRIIQQKLEHCSIEDEESVFKELVPHASKLMTDVFGNYVIQKFFEHGSPQQRKELEDKLVGQMLPLSLQMYGCRVIQKHVLERGQPHERNQIIRKLAVKIVQMSQHKYALNVVEKCLECCNTAKRELLIEEIIGQT